MVDGTQGIDADKAARTAMNPGGSVGNAVGSVQTDANLSHNHTIVGYTRNGAIGSAVIVEGFNGGYAPKTADYGYANSSGGSESRPENAYVLYCVKF